MTCYPHSFRRVASALIGTLLLTATGFSAQPTKKGPATPPTPIDPPEAFIPTGMFALPEGFEVKLWARTPLFRNPSNIDIDAQGRIWVAEAYNYRRHAGKDPAGDRIMVLQDTDGDGEIGRAHV